MLEKTVDNDTKDKMYSVDNDTKQNYKRNLVGGNVYC